MTNSQDSTTQDQEETADTDAANSDATQQDPEQPVESDRRIGDDGSNGNESDGRGGDNNGGDSHDLTPPSDPETKLLVFLDLLENTNGETVTGFEAKQLYEATLDDIDNLSTIYAELKGEYITTGRDSNPLTLTPAGRTVARDAPDIKDIVIDALATTIIEYVQDDTIIKRLFYLAHTDPVAFNWYRTYHESRIDAPMTHLLPFCLDEGFQSHPAFGKQLDALPPITDDVHDRLADLIEEDAYLRALAIFNGTAVCNLLQIDLDDDITHKAPSEVLALLGVDDPSVVIADLAREGIDPDHNVFGVDIDALLAKHRDTLAEWYRFDEARCETLYESHWDVALTSLTDRYHYLPDTLFADLIESGAVIPTEGQFMLRQDTAAVAKRFKNSLEDTLEARVEGLSNVAGHTTFDYDAVMAEEDDIIVILHDKSWSSNQHYYPELNKGTTHRDPDGNPFIEKVILVPSPTEFGFEDPHLDDERYSCHGHSVERTHVNREFNAKEDVPGLAGAKAAFTENDWEAVSRRGVQTAKEMLEEQEQISLTEAFDRLADYDTQYIVALHAIAAKSALKTARGGTGYDATLMWEDVERTLTTRYPSFTPADADEIRTVIEDIFESQAGVDLVKFTDDERVHTRFSERLHDDIHTRIQTLSDAERRLLAIYLTQATEREYTTPIEQDRHQPAFRFRYQFAFGDTPPQDVSLTTALVKSGLATTNTYVKSDGDHDGSRYPLAVGVTDAPERYHDMLDVTVDRPRIDSLTAGESTIPQVAGIDYILCQDGPVSRSKFSEMMLGLDIDAMRAFDVVDDIIIDDGEYVMVNPAVRSELREWVTQQKQTCLQDGIDIEQRLKDANFADFSLRDEVGQDVLAGSIVTRERSETDIIVAPWLSKDDTAWVPQDAVVIITFDYAADFFEEHVSEEYPSLLLQLSEEGLNIYNGIHNDALVNPLIEAFEQDHPINTHLESNHSPAESTSIANDATPTRQENSVNMASQAERQDDQEVESEPGRRSIVEPEERDGDGVSGGAMTVFDELFKTGEFSVPGDVLRDRPVVFILEKPDADRYGTTLQLLCRELYRQYEAGIPTGRIRDEGGRLGNQLTAGGYIQFIDESDGRFLNTGKTADSTGSGSSWSRVGRRLQEFDMQGLGFLIVQVPAGAGRAFMKKVERHVRPHRPQSIVLQPRLHRGEYSTQASYLDHAVSQIEAIWGYPDLQPQFEPDTTGGEPAAMTFDSLFTLGERRAWARLQEGLSKPLDDGLITQSPAVAVNRHQIGSGQESQLHYALKVFVVRNLISEAGVHLRDITTEKDTPVAQDSTTNSIPDVQVGGSVFEVETLYGTGQPVLSVTETVDKYQSTAVDDVNVVLPPIGAALHYNALRQLKTELTDTRPLNIQFRIPVLKHGELHSVERLWSTVE